MHVTLAICTRNRAASLIRTLDSLTKIEVPPDLKWELIVVNNGSSDPTDLVVRDFRAKVPLRCEFEPKPGLSNARNRAIQAAAGDYIVWTDDDVIVDRHFLAAYVKAFRTHPDAVIFGGKVIPLFEEPVPRWLQRGWKAVADAYAFRDFGDEPLPLAQEIYRVPYGANFAMRSAEQRAYLYDAERGPGGIVPGDEIDVIERMLRDGLAGYWVPEAKVLHCTSSDRETLAYLGRFYRAQGEALAFRDRKRNVTYQGAHLFGAPRWMFRQMGVRFLKSHFYRWTAAPAIWLEYFVEYSKDWGYIEFYRRHS